MAGWKCLLIDRSDFNVHELVDAPKKQTSYYTAMLLQITIPTSLDIQFPTVSLCGVTGYKLQCDVFVLKCFCISSPLQVDYFKVCSWLKVIFQSVEKIDNVIGGGSCLK